MKKKYDKTIGQIGYSIIRLLNNTINNSLRIPIFEQTDFLLIDNFSDSKMIGKPIGW